MARAQEPRTGRVYECNRADDRCKSKALLSTCGESPYTFVRRRLSVGTGFYVFSKYDFRVAVCGDDVQYVCYFLEKCNAKFYLVCVLL